MKATEIRCRHCGVLLAINQKDGLTIKRSGLVASIPGVTKLIIGCYRCSKVNLIDLEAREKAR